MQLPLPTPQDRGRVAAALAFTVGLGAIFDRLAWISDDAYITLRVVENLVLGHGPCWNAADRVQVFTHPLWLFVLAAGRVLTGEVFFTTIWIGMGLSLAAVFGLLRACATAWSLVAVAVLMVGSRAFLEYATSGLETPLSAVLLVWFATIVAGERPPARRFLGAVASASLLATNRMDLAILCLPGVIAAARGVPARVALRTAFVGTLPFALWLLFAAVYYGSPFPVTAHAKAFHTGIPGLELAKQGLFYGWYTAIDDPVTMLVIAAGAVAGACDRRCRMLALGIALYAAYVVKVGGDFMAGRFFVPPFVVALVVLARALAHGRRWPAAAIVAAALLAARGVPAWLRDPASDTPPTAPLQETRGIVDERRYYYEHFGLHGKLRGVPRFGVMTEVFWPGRTRPWFVIADAAGVVGFNAGRLGHLVDPFLLDPLLAHLPARDPANWRPGHIERRIPEGYLESLASGTNRVRHPGLRRYYGALHTIVSAPVFDPERLRTLWCMWNGDYDDDLASFLAEEYFAPPRVAVGAEAMSVPLPLGVHWFDESRLQLVNAGGLAVEFGHVVAPGHLRLQTAGTRELRLRFLLAGAVQGEVEARPPGDLFAQQRLQEFEVSLPAAVQFDTLWVDAFFEMLVPPALGGVTLAP